jgi:hypothetical protein
MTTSPLLPYAIPVRLPLLGLLVDLLGDLDEFLAKRAKRERSES